MGTSLHAILSLALLRSPGDDGGGLRFRRAGPGHRPASPTQERQEEKAGPHSGGGGGGHLVLQGVPPNQQWQYALHIACTFLHFWPRLAMLSRCLLTEFLHRSSVGSSLRLRCWLGRHCGQRCQDDVHSCQQSSTSISATILAKSD